MPFAPFRLPGSAAPAIRSFFRRLFTFRQALAPIANVTNPIPPANPLLSPKFGLVVAIVEIFRRALDAGSTAKSDLASVEKFLGYKPTAPITITQGTANTFQGGQQAGVGYRGYINFQSKWVGPATAFTSGILYGPITGIQWSQTPPVFNSVPSLIGRNSSGQPASSMFQFGGGVLRYDGQSNLPYSVAPPGTLTNLRIHFWSSDIQDTEGGGGGTAPTYSTTTAPDLFIPARPVDPDTAPAIQPAVKPTQKPKEKEPLKVPIVPLPTKAPQPYRPDYPDELPLPSPSVNPVEQPTTFPKPTAPKPDISPTRVNPTVPDLIPFIPPTRTLPPGTIRRTRYLPPADRNIIRIVEPYIKPIQKKEPLKVPLPLPIPLPTVPAKLDCLELSECLDSFFNNDQSNIQVPVYSCDPNSPTGLDTNLINVTVPSNLGDALILLFEQFAPLLLHTCDRQPELTASTVNPTVSYSESDPSIIYVEVFIGSNPIPNRKVPMDNPQDDVWFAGWFSWTRNNVRIAPEIPIRKTSQILKKPDWATGFRYYRVHGALLGCIIYKETT